MFLKRYFRLLTVSRLNFHNSSRQSVVSLYYISNQVYNDKTETPLFVKQLPQPDPIYYFERGCRVVYPYFTLIQARCLGSWVGRCVSEVYFKDRNKPDKSIWNVLIENGFIRVNQRKVPIDYVMRHSDILSHVFHFHENPIIDLPYKNVYVDEDILVIDKPPGIPMHSAGKYKFNSLISMAENEWGPVFGFNRIDAVTSGVVVLARNSAKAKELCDQMFNKKITKEYICEVTGNFPHDEIEVAVPLARCFMDNGPVIVDRHSGLPSQTLFKKIKFKHDTQTSIVSCFPLTGRTHQIRVHLQYLGFPIVNDFTYNSPAFGIKCGKNGDYGGLTDAEIFAANYMESRRRLNELREESVDVIDEYEFLLQDYRNDFWIDYTHEHQFKPELNQYCPECYSCKKGYRELPIRSKKFLRLHALRYKGHDWDFAVELPYWAR